MHEKAFYWQTSYQHLKLCTDKKLIEAHQFWAWSAHFKESLTIKRHQETWLLARPADYEWIQRHIIRFCGFSPKLCTIDRFNLLPPAMSGRTLIYFLRTCFIFFHRDLKDISDQHRRLQWNNVPWLDDHFIINSPSSKLVFGVESQADNISS